MKNTRLYKELKKRGIVFEHDYRDYDQAEYLLFYTSKYVITLWGCAVLPSRLKIYDAHSLILLGEQNLHPCGDFFFATNNKWESVVFGTEDLFIDLPAHFLEESDDDIYI